MSRGRDWRRVARKQGSLDAKEFVESWDAWDRFMSSMWGLAAFTALVVVTVVVAVTQ